jgi:hypothetical protein
MLRRFLVVAVIGWPLVITDASRTIAEENTPKAGKSTVVAASFLKQVAFRRKVVFFRRDVNLACLALSEPGRHAPDFLACVRAFEVPGANSFSARLEMTSDGILVFSCRDMILRINKSGRAEKLVSLSELPMFGVDKRPKGIHIEQLLGVSAKANFAYLSLSNEPEHAPGVVYTASGSYYLGRLDLTNRRLLLLPSRGYYGGQTVLDFDKGLVYQIEKRTVKCRKFEGKTVSHWPLPNAGLYDLCLGPDERSLLLAKTLLGSDFSLLDLKTGNTTDLPIAGRAMAWGANQTLYYLVEDDRKDGVLDTALFRYRIGEKEPTKLFMVSCQRITTRDSLLGSEPRLSTDRSWLAWQLPVEDVHERGTVLLDVTNGEYRIIKGRWEGVQWDNLGADATASASSEPPEITR